MIEFLFVMFALSSKTVAFESGETPWSIVPFGQVDLNPPVHRIISNNQECSEGGGDSVLKMSSVITSSGEYSEPSTKFKVYRGRYNNKEVAVIRCVGGPYKSNVIAISDDAIVRRPQEFDYDDESGQLNIEDVSSDVLMEVVSDEESELQAFRLYHDPTMVLGFGACGNAKVPSKVTAGSKESQFYLFESDLE